MRLSPSFKDDTRARAFCLALSYLLDDENDDKPLLRRMALDTRSRQVKLAGARGRRNETKEEARA